MLRAHPWTTLALFSIVMLVIPSGCGGCDCEDTSGTGGGGAGAGGSSSGRCTPGKTRSCYNGPANTEGQGICQEGVEVCDQAGTWAGTCMGEVQPAAEIYGNQIDEDCNGADAPSAEGLVNTGLLARYFLDEATSGKSPTELENAAPETPLLLSLFFPPSENASFAELDGHRGLSWGQSGLDTRALAAVNGTKIDTDLNDHSQVTLEAVVAIADGNAFGSPIVYLGPGGDYGSIDLRFTPPQTLSFYWKGAEARSWSPILYERCVLHLVVDTAQMDATDRIKLYRNGELVPLDSSGSVAVPPQNETIDLGMSPQYALGNRSNGARSFRGMLYYSGLYASALTEDEIATNATLLLVDDDNLAP